MAQLDRIYNAAAGVQVDHIGTLMFTDEKDAHVFVVAGAEDYGWTSAFAYFLRSDSVTLRLQEECAVSTDAQGRSVCTVTLPEDCYDVPGNCLLTIYAIDGDKARACVYAGRGMVVRSSGELTYSPGSLPATTLEAEIAALKEEIIDAHLMAVFARNIGQVEAENAKQSEYIAYLLTQMEALDPPVPNSSDNLLRHNNGSYQCDRAYGYPYFDVYRLRQEDDTFLTPFTTEWVALSAPTVPTRLSPDKEKAAAWTHGARISVTRDDLGGIYNDARLSFVFHDALPLVEGDEYTLTMWARVTAGGTMTVMLNSTNQYYRTEISGGDWQELKWSFVYQANAAYIARVSFGVCRQHLGTVELCGFTLQAGSFWNTNNLHNRVVKLETKAAELDARVTALENPEEATTQSTLQTTGLTQADEVQAIDPTEEEEM